MGNEKREIIQAGLEVHERGLVAGTWGNISRRLEGDREKFAITPSGMDYRRIEERDIVTLDLDGKVVEGEKIPSTEAPLHRTIYKSKGDVNAILHTHSVFASAVACVRGDIPPIVEDMVQIIGGSVETAEYELPGTEDLASSVLEALGEKKAALLANHGVVALGGDMEEALLGAEIVEKSAKIYLMGMLLGDPKELDVEEIDKMKEMYEDYGQS